MARKPGPTDGADDALDPVGSQPDGVLELGSYAVRDTEPSPESGEPTALGDDPAPEAAEGVPAEGPGEDPGPISGDPTPWQADTGTAPDRAGPVEAVAAVPAGASPPVRRGGAGALVLGGAVAAALGFGAAWVARGGAETPAVPADLEDRLAALEAHPDAGPLAARIDEIEDRLAALEDAPTEAGAGNLGSMRADLDAVEAREAEIQERLEALEARPPARSAAPSDGAAAPGLEDIQERVARIEDGLAQARGALDELALRLDEAEARSADAVAEARAAVGRLSEAEARAEAARAEAQARAALASVETAMGSGEAFETPLAELAGSQLSVPEPLSRLAVEGVPTLAELEADFPQAARAGLSAARDAGLTDDGGGLMGFLRSQLSLRSTAPREGDDPDAVLSRAQAQLEQGRLEAVLAALASLPDPVQAAMQDWTARAEARAEADAALAGLRDSLSATDPATDDAPAE